MLYFLKNCIFNLKHKIHFINFEIKNQASRTWYKLYYLFCFLRRPNNNNDPNAANNPPNNVALFDYLVPASGNAFALL